MKKVIVFVITICCILVIPNQNDDLIRIRVLANSNSEHDQNIKNEVVKNVSLELQNILKNENNISSARKKIKSNIENISNIVNTTILNEKYNYTINYGKNYFPEKEYNDVKYEEGEYESLLITLGDGLGDNWWCILFPPICLIEAEENEELEYDFYIKKIINKIF